jgi:hypothetical protein
MRIGAVDPGPHLSQPLAGKIGSPHYPGVEACMGKGPYRAVVRVLPEDGVIEKLARGREMVLSARQVGPVKTH